uniref:Isopenicillin N synthase-like Fe(2+) 2OG dioxygenase domain-containing protein n=1 Tax=Tetradesmus obliquus TaxID=3088 RepID=A0A383VB58_TETOB
MQPLQEVQNLAAVLNQQQRSSGSVKAHMATSAASNTQEALPVFDLSAFLALDGQPPTPELQEQCKQLAECLARTGCLVVRDPRVPAAANDTFLDMLEGYFCRSEEQKQAEARPDLAYQVGVTPSGVEMPRCVVEPEACKQQLARLQPEQQPTLPTGPDAKWRYMWRVGPRPESTQYAELNAEPVVPQGIPQWCAVMDDWGSKLLGAVQAVAAMVALGFGLPADAFTSRMELGPHLLAPTGSDLQQHGQQGTVLAAMAARGFGVSSNAFTSRMDLGPHLLAPTGSDLQQHGQQGTVLAAMAARGFGVSSHAFTSRMELGPHLLAPTGRYLQQHGQQGTVLAVLGFGLPADAFTSRMELAPHLLDPTSSDLQQHGQQGTLLAAMAALGFGLPADAFTSRMELGPHLLDPTSSDLQQHGQQGTVPAGYHYDLNFITIHGRSRFPGLSVWLADGRRLPVSIPPGCLLCQAGKQLEWLTGGHVQAGMHEVLVTDATVASVAAAKAAGRSTWRVSSTVFSHIASDQLLQPLGRFAQQPGAALRYPATPAGLQQPGAAQRYPATPAGLQVQRELEVIQLKRQ